jgi:hypothetical protein
MKACFPYMGDHWCITVDSKTGVSSWNTYDTKIYSVNTPTRCADAFASKIGLARFRAFMWACDRALEIAATGTESGSEAQLHWTLESDGYYTFDDKEVWEMIYGETMAYAELSKSLSGKTVETSC